MTIQFSGGLPRDEASGALALLDSTVTQGTDWTAGDNVSVRIARPPDGKKLAAHDGTAAAPNTTAQPTFKISRVDAVTRAQVDAIAGTGSDGPDVLATLMVAASGTVSSETQITAIVGEAQTNSTYAPVGNDACAIYGIGRTYGSADGVCLGAYLEGHWNTDAATGKAIGAEIRLRNATGTSAAGTYVTNGPSNSMGLWINASGSAAGAAAIQVGGIFQPFAVGLGFNASSVTAAAIQDDSTATISYDVRGARAAGGLAIRVRSGAGALILGADALSSTTTQLLELSTATTANPLFKLTATRAVAIQQVFNNSSGNFNIGLAANNGELMTGTVGGDGVINTGAKIVHFGRGGSTADFKVGGGIGFYGTAPQTRQAVTGSRATGAALQSLLTALATIGLVTDSSSA